MSQVASSRLARAGSIVLVLALRSTAGADAGADRADRTAARTVVAAWNRAVSGHDVDALRDLYASTVTLYGARLDRERAVASKATALRKAPGFTQEVVGPVKIDALDRGRLRASFTKSTSSGGKTRAYDAYLVLVRERNAWRVAEEGDLTTDRNLEAARARRAQNPCVAAAEAVLMSSPRVTALLSAPVPDEARRAGFRARGVEQTTRLEELAARDRTLDFRLFDSFEDHIATLAWFKVDPRTGGLREWNLVDDEDVPVPSDPALAAKVPGACRMHLGR